MASKRKRGAKDVSGGSKKARQNDTASGKNATQSKPSLESAPFVETPVGEERKREAALYELLGSEDEKERIEAAVCIISSLLDDDGVPEPVLQRHLERRLFRGIASGRNASRLGFSLVITELLSQLFGSKNLSQTRYPGLSFEKTLSFLVDKTQAIGNVPGQEERDHFFGTLFGLTCFVRSKILFESVSRWRDVLGMVLQLAYKKIWLRSQCGWLIVQALEQMDQSEAERTLHKFAEAGLARTPEGVAIWIAALERYPKLNVKPWQHPLSNKSLGDLAAVLKESFHNHDGEEQQSKSQQSGWTAQLHFVWDVILSHYRKPKIRSEDFDQFWTRVVDNGLFSKNATDGQKFKGFMVFQTMLRGLMDQPSKLKFLFSKTFMMCLMNQAAKKDRYLHLAATKALGALELTVAANHSCLPTVLRGLLGKNGTYNFDQRSNTKTVDKLLRNIDAQNANECFDIMRQPIIKQKLHEKGASQATLRTYIEYVSKLLTFSSSLGSSGEDDSEGTAFALALQELAQLAYSKPKDIPNGLLTNQIRDLCRTKLESCFAKVIRRSEDVDVFCNAVAAVDSTAFTMDEEIKSALNEALARMNKLLKRKSKSAAERSLAQGLAMLHAVSIFQLYNEDPDAVEVLRDLEQFSGQLKRGKMDEEGASELLVEMLLSMVARPSSLMREVSQQVFELFTSQVTTEGLQLLTDPLASGESTKGQKELFNTDDGDMEVDGEESSGLESGSQSDGEDDSGSTLDSDVEFAGLGEDADAAQAGDEDGNGSDDSEEEEEEQEDEEDSGPVDIDDLVGNILNSHRLDKDVGADSSDDDNDMSDSEMLALDSKLSEVFKQQSKSRPENTKKQKKDAKQSVVNFKNRILDLIHIYIKNEPLSPAAFSLLPPLLSLMHTTSKKELSNRAFGIIKNHQKVLKKARSNKDEAGFSEAADLMPYLEAVHDEAGKDESHAFAKAASTASLCISSSMCYVDKAAASEVKEVYARTMGRETKMQPSFFQDFHNWYHHRPL